MSRAALAVRKSAAPSAAKAFVLQRDCACKSTSETCARCADKRGPVQRLAVGAAPLKVPTAVGDVLRGAGQPLSAATLARMEKGFGHDFSNVRIHADAAARRSAAAVNARAYTVGRHVVMGLSAPELSTTAGQRLLGHELAHVVQQSGASLSEGIDPDPLLEREADRAGADIASGRAASVGSASPVGIQREAEEGSVQPATTQDETTQHPTMERITTEIGRVLGFGEGSSQVVAASLEGGLTGFSHQWHEGGTGERLGKSFKAFSLWDIPDVIKGYLIGAVEGIASPVTDLFSIGVMVEQLNNFIDNLASSALSRAAELAQDVRGIVGAIAAAFGPIRQFFKDIVGKGREGVRMLADLFNGTGGTVVGRLVHLARSVGRTQGAGVAQSLESPWEVKQQKAEEAGGALGKVSQWVGSGRDALIKSPWSKVGNKAGYALGFALIQVVMLVFSDGIGNIVLRGGKALSGLAEAGTLLGRTIESAAKFVTTAGSLIAKVEEGVNAAVSFLMKPLKPVLEPLMKPIAEVLERLGGFLRKLLGVAEKDAAQLATTAAAKTLGSEHPGPPAAHPTVKPQTHPGVHTSDPHAPATTHDPHSPTSPQAQLHAHDNPTGPHPAGDAAHKPLTDPEPVGGGHHTQMTPDGFELCSPPPCPNLRVIYQEQLAADETLRKEMERLDAMRKIAVRQEAIGKPDPAFAKRINREAAELQTKLEAATLAKPSPPFAKPPPVPIAPKVGTPLSPSKPGPRGGAPKPGRDDASFKGLIDTEALGKDPNVIDRLSRAREFDVGGYHDLTGRGRYGRVGDQLDSDEALQNAYLRMRKGVGRTGPATMHNPAIALGPEKHRLINNLKQAQMVGLTAQQILDRHLDQMKDFVPDYVLVTLRREGEAFIARGLK